MQTARSLKSSVAVTAGGSGDGDFPELRFLNLRGNRLVEFTLGAFPPNLRWLDLSSSRIKRLRFVDAPSRDQHLTIDVRRNPLACDCPFLLGYRRFVNSSASGLALRCDRVTGECARCSGRALVLHDHVTPLLTSAIARECGENASTRPARLDSALTSSAATTTRPSTPSPPHSTTSTRKPRGKASQASIILILFLSVGTFFILLVVTSYLCRQRSRRRSREETPR